jgi:molecular chaperone GrpE
LEEQNKPNDNQTEQTKEMLDTELPKKKEKKNKKEKASDEENLKLKEENATLNDKILRINAELQNIKRRNNEEISRLLKYDGETFIKKLLPVIDNFERAINMDDDNLEDEVSKFLSGFKMIYSNLKNILDEMEIKEIECLGQNFDPANMEAVLTEHDETKDKNIVLDCLQKGYTYKDKVIRPAMVKVND